MMGKKKRVVKIGGRFIGGGHPVMIQSMTNTDTRDVPATVAQINRLAAAGCEMVRVSIFDEACLEALVNIKNATNVPIAADIHFDYRLAVGSISRGADKIRINPGNIGSDKGVREIVKHAKERNVPIRVGVNSGSLSKELYEKYGGPTPAAMMEDLKRQVASIEDMGYENLVIAAKSTDLDSTVRVNRMMDATYDYPVHLGLTEAGTEFSGTIKATAAMAILLEEGVGDTIRYSLTADPVREVEAAKVLLRSMGLYKKGVNIISCPTCGRTRIDIIGIAAELERRTAGLDINLDVAVMGCVVNGPGEARHADIGLAGGGGKAVIFRKGEIIKTVREDEAVDALMGIILEGNRED